MTTDVSHTWATAPGRATDGRPKSIALIVVLELATLSLVSVLFTAVGFSDRNPEVMAAAWFMAVTAVVLQTASFVAETISERALVVGSYLFKVLIALWNLHGNGSGLILVSGADQLAFWNIAVEYYSGMFTRTITPYPYVINAEFHIFGMNYLCCMLANILLSMLGVAIFCATLSLLRIHGRPRILGVLMAAWMPYLGLVSCELLREPLYLVLISGSFYTFVRYQQQGSIWWLISAVALTMPVIFMHSGYFPIPLVFLLCPAPRDAGKRLRDRDVISLAVRVSFMLLVASVVLGFDSMGYLERVGSTPDEFFRRISGEVEGQQHGSSYLVGMQATSWGTALLLMPLRMVFYLFSPLPTNWRGIADVASFALDSCAHIGYFALAFKYLGVSRGYGGSASRTLVLVTLASTLLCAAVFSMGTSTAGTAIRHRDVLVPIEAVGVSVCMAELSAYQGQKKAVAARLHSTHQDDPAYRWEEI